MSPNNPICSSVHIYYTIMILLLLIGVILVYVGAGLSMTNGNQIIFNSGTNESIILFSSAVIIAVSIIMCIISMCFSYYYNFCNCCKNNQVLPSVDPIVVI